MDVEEKVPFERRSKTYKTKYFSSLKTLFGEIEKDICQKQNPKGVHLTISIEQPEV